MKLLKLLECIPCNTLCHIFTENNYGQCQPIGSGKQDILLNTEFCDTVWHLCDKVTTVKTNSDASITIFVRNKHSDKPLQKEYSEEQIKRWDNLDPSTRPWLHKIETNEYAERYAKGERIIFDNFDCNDLHY